jgi:Zn-dependent protease
LNGGLLKERERNELIISWLTITVAFSLVISDFFSSLDIFTALLISAVGVGTGFILHELSHKYVAIHYGAHAEFRMWQSGLILAIVLPIITFGQFLFAAPGAVYIYGTNITRKQNGIISVAGPVTNIVIAIFFIMLAFIFPKSLIALVAVSASRINFFLAFFNLIPIGPLDGTKVFAWNKTIWAGLFVFTLAGVFLFAIIASLVLSPLAGLLG